MNMQMTRGKYIHLLQQAVQADLLPPTLQGATPTAGTREIFARQQPAGLEANLAVKEVTRMQTREIILRSGALVHIRPASNSDALLLLEMHHRTSPSSIYDRYLHYYKPQYRDLQRMCELAPEDGAAFIVTRGNPATAIGFGYYVIDHEAVQPTAEPALLIEDRYQGQGLGKALFRHLGQHAQARGITQFAAMLYPSNRRMLQLIRRSGYTFEERVADWVREVTIRLVSAAFPAVAEQYTPAL